MAMTAPILSPTPGRGERESSPGGKPRSRHSSAGSASVRLFVDSRADVDVLPRHPVNIGDFLPGLRVPGVGPHVIDPAFALGLGDLRKFLEQELPLLPLVLHALNVR